eukprot:109444-Hanusia_phi.AAC.1
MEDGDVNVLQIVRLGKIPKKGKAAYLLISLTSLIQRSSSHPKKTSQAVEVLTVRETRGEILSSFLDRPSLPGNQRGCHGEYDMAMTKTMLSATWTKNKTTGTHLRWNPSKETRKGILWIPRGRQRGWQTEKHQTA